MRFKLVCFLAVCLATIAPWAAAQTGTGAIDGRVFDSSGAVVPSAKVEVINIATGVRLPFVTNGVGFFEALSLNPGEYRVEVQAAGFKTEVRDKILVEAEDRIGLEFKLTVGAVTEKMVVTTETPQLRTEDAQLGEVITESMIQTLPSNNAAVGTLLRDPLQLLILSGDVQGSGVRAGTGIGVDGGGQYSGQADTRINGGRTGSIEYYVDGVPTTSNIGHNVSIATPAYDDVQEFKVVTNGISAEYGRLSGGAVSVTTKSGSNGLHGQLFEYNQQPAFNANSWGNDAAATPTPKQQYRLNDYGFALGGPVVLPHLYNGRNKTFWFANYERSKFTESGSANFLSLPTLQERTGNLSDYGVAGSASNPTADIWDPLLGSSYPVQYTSGGVNLGYKRTTELGNMIPAADLDPTVQGYMALLPTKLITPIAGSVQGNDYEYLQANTGVLDQWGMRIDQEIGDKQRLFFHFSHVDSTKTSGQVIPSVPTTNSTVTPGAFAPTLGYDWTISPTTFLELRVGGNYSPYSSGNILASSFSNASLHYSPQIQALLGTTHALIGLTGIDDDSENVAGASGGGSWGLNGAGSSRFNSTSGQFSAMLTKVLGRHSVKFGYEGRRYYDNFSNSSSTTMFVTAEGVGPYSNVDTTWSPQGAANSLGQFLLGIDTWLDITSPFTRNIRTNYYASFVQDDFKVSRRLTLNLGLRWETESPITEKNNKLDLWDPKANPGFAIDSGYNFNSSLSAAGLTPAQISEVQTPYWLNGQFATGAIRIPGTPEHPSSNLNDWHPWNFAPRLGAAYQVNPKTVLRASYSILYVPTSGDLSAFASSPGINYTALASSHPEQANGGQTTSVIQTGLQTLQMPYVNPAVEITQPTRDNQTANYLASSLGQTSSGAISRYLHMPWESDWSFSIQHQLPWNVLFEVAYDGNHSGSLLAKDTPSRFPAALYTGGPGGTNSILYSTMVANPFNGQGPNNGPQVALGSLELLYPYFGEFQVQGVNAGTSNFNALNVRVQKRFSDGFQLLFNYTFSHLLDDVGGSDSTLGSGPAGGYGASGVVPQSVYTFRSTYGTDPSDQAHRVTTFYDYQLPVGRGRRFMGAPESVGAKVLDAFVGGWEASGDTVWHSGTPIVFGFATTNQGQYGIFEQYASFAPGEGPSDLVTSGFSNPNSARIGSSGVAGATPAFNTAAFANGKSAADEFTIGNVPVVYTKLRNPGAWNSNLSVLKNFPLFSSDGKRYLQFRMEGLNIFNHPGLGGYDSNFNDSSFGYITGTANSQRQIQLALKLVF